MLSRSLVSGTALECCPHSLAHTIVQSWPGPADLPVQNLFPRQLALVGGSGGPVRAFSLSGGPVQNNSLVLTESFCWSVQGQLQHGGGCQWFGGHTVWKMAKPLLNYLCDDIIADILWCLQWKLSWVFWSVWACCYRIQVVHISSSGLTALRPFIIDLKGALHEIFWALPDMHRHIYVYIQEPLPLWNVSNL